MGCDIHTYREKKVGDKWVTADEWEDDEGDLHVPWEKRAYTRRNYQLFGLLSREVRSNHDFSFDPRGLPFNACEQVKQCAEQWGVDGHSHSYLYLHELKEMAEHLKTATIRISGLKSRDEIKALNESIASGSPDWNLVFPYCEGTSDTTYERFSVDVPAEFYLGDGLAEIIKSFDDIEGDNHRLVFFFDN